MTDVSAIKGQYMVTDVSRIDTPEGMEGKNWHCYTIKRGTTEITGLKPGTLKKVTAHAKQVAEDLNARSSGTVGSPYAAKRRS